MQRRSLTRQLVCAATGPRPKDYMISVKSMEGDASNMEGRGPPRLQPSRYIIGSLAAAQRGGAWERRRCRRCTQATLSRLEAGLVPREGVWKREEVARRGDLSLCEARLYHALCLLHSPQISRPFLCCSLRVSASYRDIIFILSATHSLDLRNLLHDGACIHDICGW